MAPVAWLVSVGWRPSSISTGCSAGVFNVVGIPRGTTTNLARLSVDPADPLFLADGSDNGEGAGVTRMLADATILMNIPLASNVTLRDDPDAPKVSSSNSMAAPA
jgi:hypothetical protein